MLECYATDSPQRIGLSRTLGMRDDTVIVKSACLATAHSQVASAQIFDIVGCISMQ